MNEQRIARPGSRHEEDPMHIFDPDVVVQLDADRRERLLGQVSRRRRLRRRSATPQIPRPPRDAA